MNIAYNVFEQSINVVIDAKRTTFSKNQPEYAQAKAFIIAQDEAGLIQLVTNGMFEIPVWSHGKFKVDPNNEKVMDIETETLLDPVLAKRVIIWAKDGLPPDPLLKFHRKVIENPNTESAMDLFRFLEKNQIPITQDGNFLAYKKVTRLSDGRLVDTHSRKVPNEVGMQPTMERKKVDADRRNQCSYGYHCCGWGYLSNFSGEVILEVEVDPRDVVAVPADYNHTKMRVCSYLILGIRNEAGERTENLVNVKKRAIPENTNAKESGMEELETDDTVIASAPRTDLPAKSIIHVARPVEVKPEEQKVIYESTVEGVDLNKMTAQGIKNFIKEKYGVDIDLDNKNKQAIIKKAHKIMFP